jgi:catecholate siderophore receptor
MAGGSRAAQFLIPIALMGMQAIAQNTLIHGQVVDAANAPILGAMITAEPGAGTPFVVASDQSGEFNLELAPGNYLLRVAADGFKPWSQSIDSAQSGANRLEIVLQPAPYFESITVTEAPPGYQIAAISSATKTSTPLRDLPQSVTVITQELMRDQLMMSIGDVVKYIPGITSHQGENNRDQIVIRGNSSSADFFVDGVRDDVQYFRDLYNTERIEALKGSNAMEFGRGGGGGVVNRVTKDALLMPLHEVTLQGGSFGNKRFSTDLNQPLGQRTAVRLNAVYENSGSFRDHVGLERYGFNPTFKFAVRPNTTITAGFENFHDYRTADRGITSFKGRPAELPISTYFGDPNQSRVRAAVNIGWTAIEHRMGRLTVRNRTQIADYDRGYQNFVPGAVSADKTLVSLSAYNNATARRNLFNQTDVIYTLETGRIRHTLLAGFEAGRQLTDNFRNTGFFNNTLTSTNVPYSDPTISTPITFRQSATDADNHVTTNLAAAYLQDQIELTRHIQVITGLRFDYFDLQFHNNRTGDNLRRLDHLVSPRTGLVLKPVAALSVYGTYSVSYLPSSGDQFSSLSTITQQVKPEKFANYEAGVKWDIRKSLSVTAAVYRLDRTNTRSTDPNDPTRIVQTGSQRTNGYEVGINGSITRLWKIAGGYAYQDAFVTSSTTAARAGAQVGQVPHHTFSLWNTYQLHPRVGAGLGIIRRSDMFAAVDNTVTLPSYTRIDAAV